MWHGALATACCRVTTASGCDGELMDERTVENLWLDAGSDDSRAASDNAAFAGLFTSCSRWCFELHAPAPLFFGPVHRYKPWAPVIRAVSGGADARRVPRCLAAPNWMHLRVRVWTNRRLLQPSAPPPPPPPPGSARRRQRWHVHGW